MQLLELVPAFDAWMKSEGYLDSSRKAYCAAVRAYARSLEVARGRPADVADLNEPSLQQHKLKMVDAGNRPRTVRGRFHGLIALCEWLSGKDGPKLLAGNPAKSISLPRLDAADRELCDDDQIDALLAACDNLPTARRAALAKAIVSVFAFVLIRRQECLDLRVKDVHLRSRLCPEPYIVIGHGKGEKRRELPLAQEAEEALRTWIDWHRGVCKHDYLWDYDHARRIGDDGLRTLLREVQAAAGYRGATNLNPHSIRHAGATRMERNGADISSISIMLGHASVQTTIIYLHSGEKRLRKVIDTVRIRREDLSPPTSPPAPTEQEPPAGYRLVPEKRLRAAWRRKQIARE